MLRAVVDAAALRHNLERARQAAQDARLWAIVKANAYGHGIERGGHPAAGAQHAAPRERLALGPEAGEMVQLAAVAIGRRCALSCPLFVTSLTITK